MRGLPALLPLLVLAVSACDQPTRPPGTSVRPPSPAPPTSPPTDGGAAQAVTLRLQPSGALAIPGRRLSVYVTAWTGAGAPASAGGALSSVSDTSVGGIVSTMAIPVVDARTGATHTDQSIVLFFTSEGKTTLHVSVGNATATLDFVVRTPPPIGALVVDSFTVIEHTPDCVPACDFLVYWPLLKLREPTGSRTVTVDAIEFTIPGTSTGLCQGEATYRPGTSAFVAYLDPYPWSNDVILVRLDGTPAPEGLALARVLVHDDAGGFGEIEATGKIQRGVKSLVLPPSAAPGPNAWNCQ